MSSKDDVNVTGIPTRARVQDYRFATILACALCGLFTLIGIMVPPSMSHDAGWGMQEWKTLEAGGPINTLVGPDPMNISHDQSTRVTWWSPGQYLVPGALNFLGLKLGSALTLTAGASLLCCLLGWIQVAKHFELSPRAATFIVLFLATFRYSTLPFGIYNGGEILLQGITPWLILVGCLVPSMGIIQAAGLTCVAILIAFFAKLTGLIVVAAALFVGTVQVLLRLRRVTPGMVGGVAGSILAFGALYVGWFSRGTTPASGNGWSFRFGDVFFALAAPWGAGLSWTDMLTALLRRSALSDASSDRLPAIILWCLLPPVFLFLAVMLKGWREYASDPNVGKLLIVTAGFYAVCSVAMSAIFLHGGDVSLEERHLRAAGMLIFVCALAVIDRLPRYSALSFAVGAICGLMSLYGCFALVHGELTAKRGEIDSYSRTRQPSVDENAIAFVRSSFAREGRDDIFVLPSPDAGSAFSPDMRILSNHIEFESESELAARRYRGRVPGRLYVIMPTDVVQSPKETLLLAEFVDYRVDSWEKCSLGSSTLFIQGQADSTAFVDSHKVATNGCASAEHIEQIEPEKGR